MLTFHSFNSQSCWWNHKMVLYLWFFDKIHLQNYPQKKSYKLGLSDPKLTRLTIQSCFKEKLLFCNNLCGQNVSLLFFQVCLLIGIIHAKVLLFKCSYGKNWVMVLQCSAVFTPLRDQWRLESGKVGDPDQEPSAGNSFPNMSQCWSARLNYCEILQLILRE